MPIATEPGKPMKQVYFNDWQQPLENNFSIAEEVTVRRQVAANGHRRPDVVIWVNGIALCVIELKKANVSVAEGIDKDVLRISAGHFPDSAMPGEGNFSIAGHSSRIYTCLFNDMHKAVIGDTILVDTRNGTHRYLISDIKTVDPDDLFVIQDTRESVITIVTCTNSGKNRLIIRGVEV